MNMRNLGRTGLCVSELGYGAAEIGFLRTEPAQAERILNFLLDNGVNLIDTARMYEESEELIGRAVCHRRDQYVLVSKCGQKIPEVDAPDWSAPTIVASVDRALRRLRTDHLDVMLLHSCELEILRQGEALGALLEAQKNGKVRWVGYSGDNEAAAWAAAHADVAVVEVSINLADQANIDLVLPVATSHDVGVLAKRPLANAAWKDPRQQPGFYGEYANTYHQRLKRMGISPGELGFDGNPADAWPELALRFALSQPGVSAVLVGTRSLENARKNLAAALKGPLPAETVQTIRQAFARAQADAGEKWLAQT